MSPKRSSGVTVKKKGGRDADLVKNCEGRKSSEQDVNNFGDILNKPWKVFRVSPLYNFSKDNLKFYENRLNEEMNSKRGITSNACYKSNFTLNKNLRLNQECAESIQVEVVKDGSQTTYVGNFISWSNRKPEGEDSVSLPILLAQGKHNEVNAAHFVLCKIFDCDIQPVTLSFHALITFLVKLLEIQRNDADFSHDQIFMQYGIPDCGVNDKIDISLSLDATIIVFARVMDTLNDKYQGITTMEIILEFYNKILKHIYQIFEMDLTFAELEKVTFPDALLTSDGQVKMSTTNAAISTLNVLEHFTPLDAVVNI